MATGTQMKVVNYDGPFKVSVNEAPRPKVEHPDDAIIKVTTAGRKRCCTATSRRLL